jgi:hypothetical protein
MVIMEGMQKEIQVLEEQEVELVLQQKILLMEINLIILYKE